MNSTKKRILITIVGVVLCAASVSAEPVVVNRTVGTYTSEQESFRLVQVAEGLTEPWSFAFLPDGSVLVTEISGSLFHIDGRTVREIDGVPSVSATGQGGLLDIVLDPDFSPNRLVYFSFADRYEFGLGTAVARGRLRGTRLRDVEVIFRMNRSSGGGRHFGSRLVFGTDGMLYVTIGDRGAQDRAQDPGDHAGSLVRIRPDGSIPADNPFDDGRDGAPEVYSYGHRNAQGIAVNPETGEIWLHEHGPQGGDEINIVEAGANYGWPVITYGANYGTGTQIGEGTSKPGMEQPVTYWVPSIAPSGMAFSTGSSFPGWQGDLFVGALVARHLRRVELDGDSVVGEEVLLDGVVGRVRDVRVGPDGLIYLVTDERSGGLYRLEPVE